jgi:hypothetical protein
MTCVVCGNPISAEDLRLAWTRVVDGLEGTRVEHAHAGCAWARDLPEEAPTDPE